MSFRRWVQRRQASLRESSIQVWSLFRRYLIPVGIQKPSGAWGTFIIHDKINHRRYDNLVDCRKIDDYNKQLNIKKNSKN
jgi:hypothetical protein